MNASPRWHTKLHHISQAKKFILLVCVVIVAAVFLSLSSGSRNPFVSKEVTFADPSAHGLSIVPASCPSTPHYSGQCDRPPACDVSSLASLFGIDCTYLPDPPPQTCPTGQFLWNGVCTTPTPGSCPSGYILQGGMCVAQTCPAGYSLQGGQCVVISCSARYQCSGNDLYYMNAACNTALVQTCSWGCSAGGCLPPPPPSFVAFGATNPKGNFSATGHLQVKPTLLRNGDTTQVYWNVINATGCTVTGDNGDSWSGASSGAAGQTSAAITGLTRFTLTCASIPGATPPSVTESTSVKVIPSFQEI
ncbi:MAG: hypothetical protein JWM46_919 [Candidatus Kaiserbacteria bacterium]|nr:hypothetical protein [Candidatus Kaiserbacteria bacterium]